MCFSATASFGASAVLTVIGAVTIAKAGTKEEKVFASIPLIFAIQQFTEGMLWLSLKNEALQVYEPMLTYIFLVFAMAVWPFYIPFSIWLLEKDKKRKKMIRGFVWVGSLVALGVFVILASFPVEVATPFCLDCPLNSTTVIQHHLHYEFDIPGYVKNLVVTFSVLYIAATIVTPFLSGNQKMKWLGIIFIVSYLFAITFYHGYVISVWCFFAAILSFIVLWIIVGERKKQDEQMQFSKGSAPIQ